MADPTPVETEGPDRNIGSPKCRKYHDLQDRQDITNISSNCCCCNPCETIHPNDYVRLFKDWDWCCKCVPRVIFVRFTPDDPDDECCRPGGIPMFFGHDFADITELYYGTYAGNTLFGVSVRVDIGTWPGVACGWRVQATDTRTSPPIILADETYEIDNVDVLCDQVPEVVFASAVEGPSGCLGSLSLERVPKGRIPYITNQNALDFHATRDPRDTWPGPGDYPYGEANARYHPMFLNFCGECHPDYTTIVDLLVDGDTYALSGYENERPTWVLDAYKVRWTGSRWLLSELVDEAWTDIATGPPLPDCPVGAYTWTADEDPQCFCVTDPNFPPPHNTPPAPIELCGCCGQVCSRICITGQRHLTDQVIPPLRYTFTWFESWLGDLLIGRGWKCENPESGLTEYLFLGESHFLDVDGIMFELDFRTHSFGDPSYPYWRGLLTGSESFIYWDATGATWKLMRGGNPIATGPAFSASPYGTYVAMFSPWHDYVVSKAATESDCYLYPRFEEFSDFELYEPWAIDSEVGCSCSMHELRAAPTPPEDPRYIEIRCGFCTCWGFYCGTCRCVPGKLCAAIYFEGTWYPDTLMIWDQDVKGWVDVATGFMLLLQSDEQGRCIVVPQIAGYTPSGNNGSYAVFSCGSEVITHHFDTQQDIFSTVYQDFDTIASAYLLIVASSLSADCGRGECTEATPCYQDCGTHPAKLYATITQWTNPGEISAPPPGHPGVPPCSVTVELNYLETVDYYEASLPVETSHVKYSCWYMGVLACGCPVLFELRNGTIHIYSPGLVGMPGDCAGGTELPFVTEECDPYYADTGDVYLGNGAVPWRCIGCEDDTYHVQVVVTE